MRVLLASSDRRARERVRAALGERDSVALEELVEVGDARAAREALAATRFDLVIASRDMPLGELEVPVVPLVGDVARAVAAAGIGRAVPAERLLAETIRRLGESLASERDLDTMVREVVERARSELGAEIALLYGEFAWRGATERVAAAAGADLDPDAIAELIDSLAPGAFASPRLQAPDPAATPAAVADRVGPIGSVLGAPITARDGAIRGALVLTHREPATFNDHDLQRARAIATLAAVAIVNAGGRRELDRAVRMREQILAVASHDLRNPLSVFNMALDLLPDTDDPEQRRDVVERARRAVGRMRRLISDILDYAAIDAGTLRVERSPVRPSIIVEEAAEAVAAEAKKKSIELRVELAEAQQRIWADRGRVVQALTNLLTNAVKFTPRRGQVTLRAAQQDGVAVFSVIDTGPGIPEEEQSRLFDRYYSGSKHRKSVGLGLAIARGIAEAHDGALEVESTEGEGSTFLLSVPIDAPDA